MLRIENLYVNYGERPVLRDVSLTVEEGETVAVLGRNGAGKTTLLKAILHLVNPIRGRIFFQDHNLSDMTPDAIARWGIAFTPKEKQVFSNLTVNEHLKIAALAARSSRGEAYRSLDYFPQLKTRLHQKAGTLSGGEQQMLSIARALAMKCKLLLLDEPGEGLMPALLASVEHAIKNANDEGVGVLLVEHRLPLVLAVSHRILVLDAGQVHFEMKTEEARSAPRTLLQHLGASP